MQPDSVVVVVAVVVVSFNSRFICVYLTGIVRAKTRKKQQNKNKNKNKNTNYSFLVQSPKEAELLGLEWGHTSSKQRNIF